MCLYEVFGGLWLYDRPESLTRAQDIVRRFVARLPIFQVADCETPKHDVGLRGDQALMPNACASVHLWTHGSFPEL